MKPYRAERQGPPGIRNLALLLACLLLTSCATEPRSFAGASRSIGPHQVTAVPLVRHWGGMRQVLRDGHTEGRVALADVLGPQTLAVGALAGLAGEITVVAGTAHLAEVVDPESAEGVRTRAALGGERATLLVAADVASWSEHPLGPVPDLAALEASVRAIAEAHEIDVLEPFPFRVEGVSSSLRLHVLNHSCPIANPDGPSPWRLVGEGETVVLVGFHAENSGGILTHHGQQTHTHALLPAKSLSGHLDDVAFAYGARLFLPAP